MKGIKAPRGTSDYLPEKAALVHRIDRLAGDIFGRYQYRRLITPAFEETALFTRSIGESSDIVRKEMYTFTDRGGRSLTLRPEATASVVRAYIEHNLGAGSLPAKLFYFGNMFRYERPQAGRYREFWQLGVEALGSPGPAIDAEVITLAMEYLSAVDVGSVTLKLGSMGDDECRPRFTERLRLELEGEKEALCDDCRQRLAFNPLRVFDCKNPGCRATLAKAPKMIDSLCDGCRAHFESVGAMLKAVGIDFVVDPMLVRGFDYYTRTTFEIECSRLGAQNALGGGGRYDRLVSEYGGKPTPAVGFALGVERLILAMADNGEGAEGAEKPDIYVAVVDDKDRPFAFELVVKLRRLGAAAETDYMTRSVKSQMKHADKLGARTVLFLGPDELAAGEAVLRNLMTGDEKTVKLDALEEIATKGSN